MAVKTDFAGAPIPNAVETGTASIATPSGTTKSAYSQLIASTARRCVGIVVTVSVPAIAVTQTAYLVDIATGAGGAEVVLIPDLPFATVGTNVLSRSIEIPLEIPAGTRVAGRASDDNASSGGTITVTVHLLGRS